MILDIKLRVKLEKFSDQIHIFLLSFQSAWFSIPLNCGALLFALPLISFPISSNVKLLSLVCSPLVLCNPLVLVPTPWDWLLTLSKINQYIIWKIIENLPKSCPNCVNISTPAPPPCSTKTAVALAPFASPCTPWLRSSIGSELRNSFVLNWGTFWNLLFWVDWNPTWGLPEHKPTTKESRRDLILKIEKYNLVYDRSLCCLHNHYTSACRV